MTVIEQMLYSKKTVSKDIMDYYRQKRKTLIYYYAFIRCVCVCVYVSGVTVFMFVCVSVCMRVYVCV